MATLQFQILSDLHLESPNAYNVFVIEPKAPYLALLGDIGNVRDDGFFDFLSRQIKSFRLVFLVLGNHEPYFSSWPEAKIKMKRFQSGLSTPGKLVLLDQTRHDISSTITVLGCTLFSHVSHEQKDYVSMGLNDFYHVQDWSIEQHQDAHKSDLDWLNKEVDSISRLEPDREIVVLTHYCPLTSPDVVDPQHQGSKIASGFMTDLSNETCWKSRAVKLWAFGHTHFNCDFERDGKRVVSNQRGYYSCQSAGFDCSKIIKI